MLFFFLILGLNPFLAMNQPVNARVMVVEGWLPDESLRYAGDLFRQNKYDLVLTNGAEIQSGNSAVDGKWKHAERAREFLIRMGIDEKKVIAVRTININGSKTFSAAKSTINWLLQNRKETKSINIISLGAHARKSYVLFHKAANHQINVGIISAPPVEYHPLYWFLSLKGIWFVLKNTAGYIYAVAL